MWKRCQRRTSWRWRSSRQVHNLFAAGARRLLANMLRQHCNASFSNTPRARATTLPASGGCRCLETSLNEKITLCITRCTHSVARQRLCRVQYFTRWEPRSLFFTAVMLSCVFVYFFFSSLLKQRAASDWWDFCAFSQSLTFSVMFFVIFFLFSTQVWISKVPQRKKRKIQNVASAIHQTIASEFETEVSSDSMEKFIQNNCRGKFKSLSCCDECKERRLFNVCNERWWLN